MTATRRLLPILRSACQAIALIIATAAALAGPVLAAGATGPNPSPGSDWNLDRLMSTLAHNKSGRATFVETKYLAIAAQPVESSGELVFVAPDHLEKHTLSPKPEHLVVDGDKLTIERNQRKYTLPLAQYPELDAFIESIRATLTGNRYALEQVYKVAVAGRGDDWTLTLTPLDARMLKVVSTITLDGTRDKLHRVAIQQADGDRSVMQLQDRPAD
ncbi:outer membrane lipoprotein carrier protein LolA [Ralstonia solanacearum]|uniref:outer membrane lipoprotein carrier protein LolA n=1 Tax=Ralstonia solanacearum TaxID=305 RepID=UPI0018D03460|nr:outer membrane lipoprotein carrier protein LolA [Ralstonia solanacearum]